LGGLSRDQTTSWTAADVAWALLPALSVAFVLGGMTIGSTMDDEEYRNILASVVLQARALLDGEFPFWTSALGFGLPHPMHPSFQFHPLLPLFGLMPPSTAVRILYAVHGAVGAAGCWMLVRHFGARREVAALAASTWALSTSSLDYALASLWPSSYFGWSIYPWLVLGVRRVLDSAAPGQPWRLALVLGLGAGFLGANGHFGQIPVLALPVVVMCAVEPRRTLRRLPALVMAALIAACISSASLVRLLNELERFPPRLARITVDVTSDGVTAANMFLQPVTGWLSESAAATLSERRAHVPYFGAPLLLLAIAALVVRNLGAGPRRGVGAAFVVSLVVLFEPGLAGETAGSGVYAFRDPIALFGLVLGCLLLEAIAGRRPRTALAIGAAQMVLLVAVAAPFVYNASRSSYDRRAVGPMPIMRTLGDWAVQLPGRWYLAPVLDARIRRGDFLDDGLSHDTWLYRGLPVVNGRFKGLSADTLYPSGSLPIGRIEGHQATVGHAPGLDVLGIGVVLATADEPVAPSLEEVARVAVTGAAVRVLRNPDAWSGAAFVDPAVLARPLPDLDNCGQRGLLCRDFSGVVSAAHDTRVTLTRRHGTLTATFAPGDAPRRLLVSEMYRPGWQARAGGGSLSVAPAWAGLIAVDVPPGIREVTLRYRPALVVALTWTSGVLLVGLAAGLALTAKRFSFALR
jgi:hypothetical protein